jgi:uncharacterized NAD(P)/FAD-binding protein YdhS
MVIGMDSFCIGVVGCGLSGASFIIQLDRALLDKNRIKRIVVFDPNNSNGRGIAYAKSTPNSLITNTGNSVMTVCHEDRMHFCDWLRDNTSKIKQKYGRISLSDGGFVPRALFGDYIEEHYLMALDSLRRKGLDVSVVNTTATQITCTNGTRINFNGNSILVKRVFLAVGNEYTNPYQHAKQKYFHDTAYCPDLTATVLKKTKNKFLVVGSKISAIDAVISIIGIAPDSIITMASKTGRLPAVKKSYIIDCHPDLFTQQQMLEASSKQQGVELLLSALEKIGYSPAKMTPLHSGNNDNLAAFRQELENALLGKQVWERIIWSMTKSINQAFCVMSRMDQDILKNVHLPAMIHYISSFPITNALKLNDHFNRNKLSLKDGLDNIVAVPNGTFEAIYTNGEREFFDGIVSATGIKNRATDYKSPLVRRLICDGFFELENGNLLFGSTTMLVKTTKPIEMYVAGSLTSGTYVISNSVMFCVEQAHKIVSTIVSESKLKTKCLLNTKGLLNA